MKNFVFLKIDNCFTLFSTESQVYEFLDKEFQKIVREASKSREAILAILQGVHPQLLVISVIVVL
ncbi:MULTISPECIES: hypothetical protein [Spirulina sp. CCY15215]|uniref:hypothetical protein n=1 Tax=Spirulina sp. CCY15215 TaxID=2767591 RepID=UPI001951B1A1|nr:hypothetical protein [Spirulina major]